MSLAADTREAARACPFLVEALRAGVVNYAATARWLDVAEDTEAVATALRRFAEALPARTTAARRARVTMHGVIEAGADDPLLRVGDVRLGEGDGSLTAVVATGDVDDSGLSAVLSVLLVNGIEPVAAGMAGDTLVVVVERRAGPAALQHVEAALSAVPTKPTL